jgi:hypothetical protein
MARYRLRSPHYINVGPIDGQAIEYEYKETNRDTGRQARKVFPVPMHLDPKEPSDCNYPGEIIVATEAAAQGRDYIFFGDPTPEMEPLDAEAEAVVERLRPRWEHPIDTLPAQGLDAREQAFVDAFAKMAAGQNVSTKGVDPDEFAKLKKAVEEMGVQNAELRKQLAAKTVPEARRA